MPKRKHFDPLVAVIRSHKLLGRGSCSSIDECVSDQELHDQIVEMRREGDSDADIIAIMLDAERIFWEREGIKWPREDKDEKDS